MFGKLFGKGKAQQKPNAPETVTPPPEDPSTDPNMIPVYDSAGRKVYITKEDWCTSVLPETIKTNWNDPDQLYALILAALTDGFRKEIVDAAKQLYTIDSHPERGACTWGIVLMEEGRFDESEKIFREFIAAHGEQPHVLTNLAKIFSRRGEDAEAEKILWHALELDPNQENGMGWYFAIHRERSGDEAGIETLRRIAAIPGSWRAQLWLAHFALEAGDEQGAFQLYDSALANSEKPAPTDLLMQMSGELGSAGKLEKLLAIVEPRFVAELHGLNVGNNLLKAHLELGHVEAARNIFNQLSALERMDWAEALNFWERQIEQAKGSLIN